MSDETDAPPDDGPDNATSRVRSESHKRRLAREAFEAREFWKAVFGNQVGRREMWRLLQQMHPFEERFACGPNGFPQPDATWFNAGQQSIGLRIYHAWAVLDRDGVFQMHDENDSRFAKKAGASA